jgi:hypothetical protein
MNFEEMTLLVLLDTSETLEVCATELGVSRDEVEQLITPLSRFLRQKPHQNFAIDNGAFAGFNQAGFLSLLQRESEAKHLCRFVVVPDVVGDARRTLEVFEHWQYRLTGWPLALAAQDGIEDLTIPWRKIAAIFIGGSDKFKLGQGAKACIAAGRAMGKWVHVGRVNTPGRFEYFENLGASSIDGTGLSRYSWMRERIFAQAMQPSLLGEGLNRGEGARTFHSSR